MASLLSFSVPNSKMIRASSSQSVSAPTVSVPENLTEKFGRKGIKFLESDNIPIVELTVRNGSSLRLQIPNAHVTSYKPKVYWKDDGFQEVLYTIPGNGTDVNSTKAKGGIGLVLNDVSEAGSKGSLVSTSEWTVKDVDSDSIDALQVFFFRSFFVLVPFETNKNTETCTDTKLESREYIEMMKFEDTQFLFPCFSIDLALRFFAG